MNSIQKVFLQGKKISYEETTKSNMSLFIKKMILDIMGVVMFVVTLAYIGINVSLEETELCDSDFNDNSVIYVLVMTFTTMLLLFLGEKIKIK